jgi:hypothetical protein
MADNAFVAEVANIFELTEWRIQQLAPDGVMIQTDPAAPRLLSGCWGQS